jgi:hypothetical protein
MKKSERAARHRGHATNSTLAGINLVSPRRRS